jgi:ketosteroid isomerase-like protein
MSSANLDLVRSVYADWERGDFGANEWAHPDIEFVVADGPEPGRWIGTAGMSEGNRAIVAGWEDIRLQPDEYRELEGRTCPRGDPSLRARKDKRLEIGKLHSTGANLFHLHAGKVTRIVVYWDRAQALADLGLPPSTGT